MKNPLLVRTALGLGVAAAATFALYGGDALNPRARSALGAFAFIALAFACSANLRAINLRVVLAGMAMQVILALLILRVDAVHDFFRAIGEMVKQLVEYSRAGAVMIFGPAGNSEKMDEVFGPFTGIPFFVIVTTTVIFIASLFSILYHLRVLQAVVLVFAKLMVLLMGRRGVSGAESLSATANVFMGQTEAPLIVKPYVGSMTRSELLAVMVGGMATVAGGVMAIYIDFGADATALLATSVMAAPCGLYIAKILVPETETPVTRGHVQIADERKHANAIDAAAAGASDGMKLVLNIIAMLIAFLALIALVNGVLRFFDPGWSLERGFAWLFSPVSALMGVDAADVPRVAQLLGIKLVGNEFIAFKEMTDNIKADNTWISERSRFLTTFALTGFANISSIGIQLGGIGGIAPERRAELARLGLTALLGGFLATLINASIAGIIMLNPR